jgi:hypothetical protein
LTVAVSDPSDHELIQKLKFILNREIALVVAPREELIEAINLHYGQCECESVDSMLQVFTDRQIDFTETAATASTEQLAEMSSSEFELCLEEPSSDRGSCEAEAGFEDLCLGEAGPEVERQATVRYYHRMNPEKMFPLLVILSQHKILEVAQRGVAQSGSKRFKVTPGSVVEVEPILPGCTCYPPREQLRIVPGEAQARFWVVPHVMGQVMQARVVLRQQGGVLAEVPLEMRVVKQTATVVMAALACLLPMLAAMLQNAGIDLQGALKDGVYSRLTGLLLGSFSPDLLALLLLLVTGGLYLWLRPRKRDLFWDVVPASPEKMLDLAEEAYEAGDEARGAEWVKQALAEQPESQATLLFWAERHYRKQHYRDALALYRKALALGKAPAAAYSRAALAASQLDKNGLALSILTEATEKLQRTEVTGAMWYNMGCFAARLGLVQDAMRYLGRAVDAGYADLGKYRTDPDLNTLRGKREFRTLLACLDG